MDRFTQFSFVTLVGFCFLAGCGDGSSSATPAATATAASTATTDTGPMPIEDISRAASDFLDAVLKGDTQRASARLTPQAMQRIIASGKQFAPPGLETATFRIGQIRAPSRTQALVQCVLTDTSSGESPRSEELCCLMRLVENDWRVSGIAYGTGPDQPWTLSNFETGQTMPIARQPMARAGAGPQPAAPAGGRPSPPRTAQEPAPATVR